MAMATNLSNALRNARRISTSEAGEVYRDRVSSSDRSDYYRFQLERSSYLVVTLRKLNRNADLFLLDSTGREIRRSRRSDIQMEAIIRPSTAQGTYYLRVDARDGATNYRLDVAAVPQSRFGGGNLQPPAVTSTFFDLNPGSADSNPTDLTVVNNRLFFVADDGTGRTGRELWMTDGSENPMRVVDLLQGSDSSNPSELTDVNGTLYFAADDGIRGRELFRTTFNASGTEASTSRVSDINSGLNSSNPTDFVNVNGRLYFTADDGIRGRELRSFDPTTNTVALVRDIIQGSLSSDPRDLVNANGTLYFTADDGIVGRELWRTTFNTDGTVAGTSLVRNINLLRDTNGDDADSNPADLIDVNGVLFFTANDGIRGRELWRSDGTVNGTDPVLDLNPGEAGAFADPVVPATDPTTPVSRDRQILADANGVLYFAADNGNGNGTELFSTTFRNNGSVLSTSIVSDINSGSASSDPGELTRINGVLYFAATNAVTGRELWRITRQGRLQLVNDITPQGDSNPADFTLLGRNLFFAATTPAFGRELRVYAL
jgi:ELWxxDGT repeat protein